MYGLSFSSRSGGGTQCLSFWYEPKLTIGGNLPRRAGRKTSALSRVPSRSGISTSLSTIMPRGAPLPVRCRRTACSLPLSGRFASERSIAKAVSFHRDVAVRRYFCPFPDLLLHEILEFGGRAVDHDGHELLGQCLLHLRLLHCFDDGCVDAFQERRRDLGRREQAVPRIGAETRKTRFGHGGHVRQLGPPRGPR